MPVISLYWFAAQQTSTLRHQKSHSIYSKFSVELSELTPNFQNPQEVASKLQKPNNAPKTQIYIFCSQRVKARVTDLQKYLKTSFFIFTSFMVIFSLKKISIRSVFISNLTLINPSNSIFGLKSQKMPVISLYWFAAQQQTSTCRR